MLDHFLALESATLLAGGKKLQHFHTEFIDDLVFNSDADIHRMFRVLGDLYVGRIGRVSPWANVTVYH
jgi:hypothetical protein